MNADTSACRSVSEYYPSHPSDTSETDSSRTSDCAWSETSGATGEDSDIRLLLRIAAQDEEALNILYRRYRRGLGGFLRAYLASDDLIDEAINDALLVIWRKAGEFDTVRASVSTWFFGIAYYAGLKLRTQAKRDSFVATGHDEWLHEVSADPATDPACIAHGWELGAALSLGLERLSPAQRDVIALTFDEGLTYQQIASRIGVPENTVKTRMFHARRMLAKALTPFAYNSRYRRS